jgi:hypothetical protein
MQPEYVTEADCPAFPTVGPDAVPLLLPWPPHPAPNGVLYPPFIPQPVKTSSFFAPGRSFQFVRGPTEILSPTDSPMPTPRHPLRVSGS